MDKLMESYQDLSLNLKREILLDEVSSLLKVIEELCIKRNYDINKLKTSEYIKKKDKLFEDDYYDLLYLYIVALKEDLATIL